jgi:hypothetical protein
MEFVRFHQNYIFRHTQERDSQEATSDLKEGKTHDLDPGRRNPGEKK